MSLEVKNGYEIYDEIEYNTKLYSELWHIKWVSLDSLVERDKKLAEVFQTWHDEIELIEGLTSKDEEVLSRLQAWLGKGSKELATGEKT